jgi:hypothetical protein
LKSGNKLVCQRIEIKIDPKILDSIINKLIALLGKIITKVNKIPVFLENMKLAFVLLQIFPKVSNFRINVQTIAIHQFLGSGITAGRGALKGLVGVCGVFAGVLTGGGAVAGILSISYSRFSRTTEQRTTKKLLLVILIFGNIAV